MKLLSLSPSVAIAPPMKTLSLIGFIPVKSKITQINLNAVEKSQCFSRSILLGGIKLICITVEFEGNYFNAFV